MSAPANVFQLIAADHRPPALPGRAWWLGLLAGWAIIAATVFAWVSLIRALDTGETFWTGPDDYYLLRYRPVAAWLWRNDPHGLAMVAWGLLGLATVIPRAPTWLRNVRATWTWSIANVLLCLFYGVHVMSFLMMPLDGRFHF